MNKTNLLSARVGQIWRSTDGHSWIVSAVYDFQSTLLIDFRRTGSHNSVIEKSVFSNASGWTFVASLNVKLWFAQRAAA